MILGVVMVVIEFKKAKMAINNITTTYVAKISAGLLLLLNALQANAAYSWNFPEPVTPMALDTLHVHNKFMVVTMIVFVSVLAIMIYSIFAHRKSKGYKAVADKPITKKSEVFWTLVPFAILLWIDFILMGIPAYHSVVMMEDTRDKATMVVKVTGSQWRWQYEYMDGDAQGIKFLSNLTTTQDEMHNVSDKKENYLLEVDNHLVLPVGEKVRVLLTATDVLHNWWVPQFGSARVAVPGFIRETWVQVDKAGTYRGQCKELCGKGHGYMPVVVDALPMDEYKIWVAEKKAELQQAAAGADKEWTLTDLVATGKGVYEKNCAVCHQINGAGLPPAFPPMTGSAIVNGAIFDANGKYLKDSHLDRLLNGKGVMPAWKSTLNDTEIAAVITYERNALGNSVGDLIQPSQVKVAKQ